MPGRNHYASIGGKQVKIRVEWRGFWSNATVYLDDSVVGSVEKRKDLKLGKKWQLPSNDVIGVKLQSAFMGLELQVTLNGKPIEGSVNHPLTRIKIGTGVVFFLAGLNLLGGLVAMIFQPAAMLSLGYGVYNLVIGSIYGFAAFLMRRRSIVGISIAIALFLGDTVMAFLTHIRLATNVPSSWIIVRMILAVPIFQAAYAIAKLRTGPTDGK